MKAISEATDLIINNNPIYSIMIKTGVVNYTSLARKIKAQVESMMGKEIKLNTLVKYITGITPNQEKDYQLEFLKKSNLSVEYKYSEKESSHFEVDEENLCLLYKMGNIYKSIKKNDPEGNLACIRVTLPENARRAPGITLFVVEFLELQQVNIEKIYRFDLEIMIICQVREASNVVSKLSDLLFSNLSAQK